MAVFETWLNQDLQKPLKPQVLDGSLFTQDNAGNLVGVILTNNGEPAQLAGTVSGSVIRADGATVATDAGVISDNKAYVLLPESAYAVPGQIVIVIKLTTGSIVTTIGAAIAFVQRSATGSIIDPGDIIPSIADLIDALENAEALIPADKAAIMAAIAPTFSSGAYHIGQYAWYNGALYRFIAEHSGTWNASDVAEVPISKDIASLIGFNTIRSMIPKFVYSANGNYLFQDDLSIEGYYFNTSTGELVSDANASCGYVPVYLPGNYKFYQTASKYGSARLKVPTFDVNKTFVRYITATADDDYIVSFSLTAQDVSEIAYIGAAWFQPLVCPMLIWNGTYPSDMNYISPDIRLNHADYMTYKGLAPQNVDTLLDSGWYRLNNTFYAPDGHYTLPEVFSIASSSSGFLAVLSPGLTSSVAIQICCYPNAEGLTFWRYADGTTPSAWVQYLTDGSGLITGLVSDVSRLWGEEKPYASLNGNYFDPDTAEWNNGLYDTNNGTVDTSGGDTYQYAYVPLVGAGLYTMIFDTEFGSNSTFALCDESKTYKAYTGTKDGNKTTATITDEQFRQYKYTVVIKRKVKPYYPKLFYQASVITADEYKLLPKYGFKTDALYKKTLVTDGDSICEATVDLPMLRGGYFGRLKQGHQMIGANYAVGGGTITAGLYFEGGSARHWICRSIDTIYSNYPALDYLLLEGGTNDADVIGQFVGDTPPQGFGTWDENDFSGSYDDETFCGAVDEMFYKAVTYYPNAKIGFVVAMEMGRYNSTIANRKRYFDEIVKIAKKWHIPVLNLWENAGVDARLTAFYDSSMTNAENVAAGHFYYDGQHPTSWGYEKMNDMIEAWVKGL